MVTQGPVAPSGWVLSGRANFGASESHYAPVTGGCQREFTPHLVRPLVGPPNIQANDRIRRKAFHHRHLQPADGRGGPTERTARRPHIHAYHWPQPNVRYVVRRGRETGCAGLPRGVAGLRRMVLLAERGTCYQSKADATAESAARDLNARNCHRRAPPVPDDSRARAPNKRASVGTTTPQELRRDSVRNRDVGSRESPLAFDGPGQRLRPFASVSALSAR